MKKRQIRITGIILAGLMILFQTGSVLAAESRDKISDVSLYIDSTIEAGSSNGDVSITTGDSRYQVGDAEILNDDEDWSGGMTPRVCVELYANDGYYFASPSKSMFSFSGDDARYSSARREDNQATLVLTIKLDKLDNGDLTVTGLEWDESDGTASWDENTSAKYYQVKLYRDESSVVSTRTTYETYYEFAGNITRRGDYYFTVRAVGSGSEKGDWESSDTWYVSSSEADDISDGYSDSDGPGGSSSYSGGGPGAVSGSATTGGNHWCLDARGWWYQYAGGSYPVNTWQQIDGKWYCFGQDGYLRYGWINWNGTWYYTDGSGAMLVNTRTPDGYYVGGDGAWIQ